MTIPSYFVYILQCVDGSFYIGMTQDIWKRLLQHNGKTHGGAKYTRNKRPVVLRYYEKVDSYKSAAQRERSLKRLTHLKKGQMCDGFTCILQTE